YLMKDFGFLLINIPFMMKLKRKKLISKKFSEKIMLVVTSVNGCTYCEWYHAKMARKSGISNAEVQDLLNSQFNVSSLEEEIPALLYAQHYAETNRNPEPTMKRDLVEFYGKTKARAIELNIKAIWFGNLSGNTFDAYRSRREGKKAQNSNVVFEFIFYILTYPILSPLVPILKKQGKI
ncbi:MAG: carboxymuconolactone decarboxylase family protein, partial [Bacteroidota bacterium]|nr:carboxymuconolactone decarboxylase family protein [Bacteroidota bacterium]